MSSSHEHPDERDAYVAHQIKLDRQAEAYERDWNENCRDKWIAYNEARRRRGVRARRLRSRRAFARLTVGRPASSWCWSASRAAQLVVADVERGPRLTRGI